MAKRGYFVQMHLHTSDTSGCGRSTGAEMANACKDCGYHLIAITDHFMNANIGCDRNISWEEKVEYLFRGYYSAKAEGDRIGLSVIRGWETFQNGRELLTYGLDEDFLLKHPNLDEVPYYEYIRIVNEAGGKIIHAHPYRRASYIPEFTPDPDSVEAYEVYNAGNSDELFNALALKEANAKGLLKFAGSDAHSTEKVMRGAMRFTEPVFDIHDIFEKMRAGKGSIVRNMDEVF